MKLLALLLLGCGTPTSLDCAHGEVACGVRVSNGTPELRCVLDCEIGRWVVRECESNCGPGRFVAGINSTSCSLPPVACLQ